MEAASKTPMERALAQARAAGALGEVPIGAVIVGPDGAVLAEAGNRTEADRDPTAHAELLAIRAADPKGGGIEHGPRIFSQPTCHHRPEVYGGIAEREAGDLLRAFFRERR